MRFLPDKSLSVARLSPLGGLRTAKIRTKLLLVLIPSVVAVLFATGVATSFFSQKFLRTALERTGVVQTLAMAHAVERVLENAKDILLFYSDQPADPARMEEYLAKSAKLKGMTLCEFAYLSLESGEHVYLVREEDHIHRVPKVRIEMIRPNPFALIEPAKQLQPGEVMLRPLFLLDFTLGEPGASRYSLVAEAVRLITPRVDAQGRMVGLYLLSFLAEDLRNVLSLYNSEKSPVFGFPRSPEDRYAYLFDTDGWIHFQSEDHLAPGIPISTYTARAGYSGTLGYRGLEAAFRPETRYFSYWSMVDSVRSGSSGIIDEAETEQQEPGYAKAFYMPYAPVWFYPREGDAPQVIGGVSFVDKSRLTLKAGYKQIDVLFLITLTTIVLISVVVFMLSREITRPIHELKRSVRELQIKGSLEEIQCPDRDYETTFLKNALNELIRALRQQIEELRVKDEVIVLARMRERVSLPGLQELDGSLQFNAGIIGECPVMKRLFADALKAAQVEADVLVMGETGTGKQLVAEAIHRLGSRAAGPFISINCGALDEHLLLDTLFGHVKGAFTEAKQDRKGAFLAANRGVLFLDEIQNATPQVQQALLQAISTRRFRPLGSDQEIAIDVRIIAATNVVLSECIEKGTFREDLYYRLKVISISTPPLREHKEDIPALAVHFLRRAEERTGKSQLGLSRGALTFLMDHEWPGNVREMENAILRAAVMAEGNLIHSSHIQLGDESLSTGEEPGPAGAWKPAGDGPASVPPLPEAAPGGGASKPGSTCGHPAPREAGPGPEAGLNARQLKVLPIIQERGAITRGEYQELAGGIPSRTALNDLGDLVRRNLLVKKGSGPATRYLAARR